MRMTMADKRLISKRDITIELFELENGNAHLEANFLDPYHLIRMEMEVDPDNRKIVKATASMPNSLAIGKGVMREVAKRVGGALGCVHLRELTLEVINFAATALIGYDQGLGLMSKAYSQKSDEERFQMSKDILKGTCRIYS
jgi:hypothetical protein